MGGMVGTRDGGKGLPGSGVLALLAPTAWMCSDIFRSRSACSLGQI